MPRPDCGRADLVIDGEDLHPYQMAARNRSLGPTVRDALWEYQGTTTLSAGPHWIRLQDVLPEIVALRLEPVAAGGPPAIPRQRYPVPDGDFLARDELWQVENLFGQPGNTALSLDKGGTPALRFSTTLANVDRGKLFGGDCVRLVHRGEWDLESFGRLRFRFEGQGSGHVASLWAVDLKGDEKLLWRARDAKAGPQDVSVPISFEGNEVFDPGHVAAICLELDEGNVKVYQVNRFAGAMVGPVFDRRDVIEPPPSYAAILARARQAMGMVVGSATGKPAPLVAACFRPWTKPVMPEDHPLYAKCEPKPVTRRMLGYELHCTGARDVARLRSISSTSSTISATCAGRTSASARNGRFRQGPGLSGRTPRNGEAAGRCPQSRAIFVRHLGLRALR